MVGVGWRFYRSHQQCTDVSPLRWAADPPTAGRQGPGGQAPQSLQQTWTARPRCGPNHLGLCLFFLNHRWAGRINLAAMPTPTGKALTPPCGILCSTLIPAAPPRRSPFSPFSPFSLHPSLLSSLFSPRQSKSASQPGLLLFGLSWCDLTWVSGRAQSPQQGGRAGTRRGAGGRGGGGGERVMCHAAWTRPSTLWPGSPRNVCLTEAPPPKWPEPPRTAGF